MSENYWLDRWKHNEIGFHQDFINPYLLSHWQSVRHSTGGHVFVPLCGKTRDMLWLRDQGNAIIGVELSELAVSSFYQENSLKPAYRLSTNKKFVHFTAEQIDILQGDFFDLSKEDLANINVVYDRAALVALPPEVRQRYVNHLLNILPPATEILLISFDYPQQEMQGPPYAVAPDEVYQSYQTKAAIQLLQQADVLDENPRFQQRGISRLQENIFLLTVR